MADISFQTDQSGANSEICATSNSVFNFSVAANYTATHASFVMKRGSSSTGSVTVAIYNGANASGSVVASVAIPAASFSQTYTPMSFNFPANTNLLANSDYSLKVSSTSSCSGSAAYFIKAGSFQILSANATILSVGYAIAAPAAAETTVTATASRISGLTAASICNSEVLANPIADFMIGAAPACDTALMAAISKLSAGETNTWYCGYALIDKLYFGSTKINKAYLGSTLVLEQLS